MTFPDARAQPLRGRTAIVTGSGRNIGRGIALALAAAGANLVLNGNRDVNALESVAAEVRALGVGGIAVLADVGDAHAVERMVQQGLDGFGSIDIAVSNVSVRQHQPFLEIGIDDWNRVIGTNLSAAFFLARACLPAMLQRRWGRIIHISGIHGFAPKPNHAHNVTCKAGVLALAKAIAVEFGPSGITANAIAPGMIETIRDPAQSADFERKYESHRQSVPVRRLGRVEDIADTCLYLCSDAGGYVTGQVLHVNGGDFMP